MGPKLLTATRSAYRRNDGVGARAVRLPTPNSSPQACPTTEAALVCGSIASQPARELNNEEADSGKRSGEEESSRRCYFLSSSNQRSGTQNGERNPFTHTRSFDTEAEAFKWNEEQERLFERAGHGSLIDPDITLAAAADLWLAKLLIEGDDKKGPIRSGTHRLYRENLERYVKRQAPTQKGRSEEEAKARQEEANQKLRQALASVLDIGVWPVAHLKSYQLEDWALALSQLKGRGLAKRVLRDVKAILTRTAVMLSIPNVWKDVKLDKKRGEDSGVVIVLQTAQATAIMSGALQLRDRGHLTDADGSLIVSDEESVLPQRLQNSNAGKRREAWARWAPLTWLLFRAGLRIGEGLALLWGDIDWEAGRIRVERTVSDRGRAIEATKTGNGKRWVHLDAEMMGMLQAYREWCETPRSKNDPNPRRRTDAEAYMFGTKRGEKWDNQQNFRRAWDVLLSALGLVHDDGCAWASPHDARHWHASILFASDVPLHDISLRLGHGDASITAKIYVHVLGDRAERDRRASDALGSVLLNLAAA